MAHKETPKRNILVVDPDKDFCNSVRLYLEDSYMVYDRRTLDKIDYTVMLKRIDFLLINADYIQKDFGDVLSRLRLRYPSLIIIVLYTSFSAPQDEKTLAQLADAMLAKPFDVKLLKKRLDTF